MANDRKDVERGRQRRLRRWRRQKALAVAVFGMMMHIINGTVHSFSYITETELDERKVARGKVNGARYIRLYQSRWVKLYLGTAPTYPRHVFRCLFRVPRTLFLKLHKDLTPYRPEIWGTRYDALVKEGIRSEVKMLV